MSKSYELPPSPGLPLGGVLYVAETGAEYRELKGSGYAAVPLAGAVTDIGDAPFALEAPEELDIEDLERIYCRIKGLPACILSTDRLLIREASLDDLEDIYRLYEAFYGDPYTIPLDPCPRVEAEKLRAYIDNIYTFYELGMWLVYEKHTGVLIGRAGIEPGENGFYLGYMIHPASRGLGYGYEAARAVTDYFLRMTRGEGGQSGELYVKCAPDNAASIAIIIKLGGKLISNTIDNCYSISSSS